jgi:acyl-coenzyme A thioesterase PaaI-like protein
MTADTQLDALGTPFRDAIAIEPLGDGRYTAELGNKWAVGPKAHGGLLMALMARAGLDRLAVDAPGLAPDPLAVSADFMRAPDQTSVELHTEPLKTGRTVSVVSVRLFQDGKLMLAASVTAGRLPDVTPSWTDLPDMPAEPPADALVAAVHNKPIEGLAGACELRYDGPTIAFLRRETGPPVLRGWVRPRGEEPDALFAVMAADILPPTVFNLGGRFSWAPTVQMTTLLRARPAPGWLRLVATSATVAEPWFDEDVTVIDSTGKLICQGRQLALAPQTKG